MISTEQLKNRVLLSPITVQFKGQIVRGIDGPHIRAFENYYDSETGFMDDDYIYPDQILKNISRFKENMMKNEYSIDLEGHFGYRMAVIPDRHELIWLIISNDNNNTTRDHDSDLDSLPDLVDEQGVAHNNRVTMQSIETNADSQTEHDLVEVQSIEIIEIETSDNESIDDEMPELETVYISEHLPRQ